MPQATGLVAELRAAFPHDEVDCELVQSSGGAFEISLDGRKLFSKLALKRFPAYQEIPKLILG
ncbi:MAG: SelT/SelW/SelH family protein [Planctomycetota bacterium]|nr:MAG: SelT/SelW/SelH family protein [Planctomycetota bacterium]